MTTVLHQKYDLRLPRYTSYPTAPHFSQKVGSQTFSQWLSELDPGEPISLYLHIPYCEELCYFCGCNTKITRKIAPVETYLADLYREIGLLVSALPARMKVSHLHFGGGSPTILPDRALVALMARISVDFGLVEGGERALEMDPRTTRRSFITAMGEAGITRASLGVQDFDPAVQKAVNRIQPYETVKTVIDGLRGEGVTGINLDLMYGLPYQSTETVRDTVDKAADLQADRLAVFGYAHVPWMKKHQKLLPEAGLPDARERWSQYEAIRQRLAERGYVCIGLDHFARADDPMALALQNGSLKRNFQGYTTDRATALIGIGASAISGLPQGYAQNHPAIHKWRDEIKAGRFAVEKGCATDADDVVRRDIINRLMCDMRVDLQKIRRDAGLSEQAFHTEWQRLSEFADDGICDISDGRITVTEQGRPLVRLVASVFDTYLTRGTGQQHSKAV